MMNQKQKCCCGCPQRAATSILLWWTAVCCIAGLYVINYQAVRLHHIIKAWGLRVNSTNIQSGSLQPVINNTELSLGVNSTNYQSGSLPHVTQDTEWDWLFQNHFIRIFLINLLIIVAVICIIGLYGVYTKNPRLLMPYIVYRTVVDILIVLGFLPLMLDMYLNPKRYGDWEERMLGNNLLILKIQDQQDSFDHIFILFILIEFLFVAVEVHFIKVILSCYDLMESSARTCKNEILALSNLRDSSPNGKFYFTYYDKEISTAV